jgi:hypothetical protein
MVSTTPPSSSSAAPVVAGTCGEATSTIILAPSPTVAGRWMIELGRAPSRRRRQLARDLGSAAPRGGSTERLLRHRRLPGR